MRRLVPMVVVVLLVLAGCSAPRATDSAPLGDHLGWENGYGYTDEIDVTMADGLNASERPVVVARTMARVEHIRQLEFREPVPVTVISRDEYRNRTGLASGSGNETFNRWNDQVWEALFLVGEDTGFHNVSDEVLGSAVQGYYAPGTEELVIVSDSPTPTINRRTLAHELVHALQAQHLSFGPQTATQDGQLANKGLVEGDATLVTLRYEDRCGSDWDCLPLPPRSPGSGASLDSFQIGVFLTIYQPYATGPRFVQDLHSRGGWAGVDAAYDRFPRSTEQVIHPTKYPGEEPVNVSVADRSRGGWTRYDLTPQADTVGEASIFAMFQANGQLPNTARFSYDAPPSAGWGGDTVYPYRNGERDGYVWRIQWDTESDAREFLEAYTDLLAARGAARDGSVFVIPDSDSFGDAFRVTRSGTSVTIVNGPDREAVEDIHSQP